MEFIEYPLLSQHIELVNIISELVSQYISLTEKHPIQNSLGLRVHMWVYSVSNPVEAENSFKT